MGKSFLVYFWKYFYCRKFAVRLSLQYTMTHFFWVKIFFLIQCHQVHEEIKVSLDFTPHF